MTHVMTSEKHPPESGDFLGGGHQKLGQEFNTQWPAIQASLFHLFLKLSEHKITYILFSGLQSSFIINHTSV